MYMSTDTHAHSHTHRHTAIKLSPSLKNEEFCPLLSIILTQVTYFPFLILTVDILSVLIRNIFLCSTSLWWTLSCNLHELFILKEQTKSVLYNRIKSGKKLRNVIRNACLLSIVKSPGDHSRFKNHKNPLKLMVSHLEDQKNVSASSQSRISLGQFKARVGKGWSDSRWRIGEDLYVSLPTQKTCYMKRFSMYTLCL